MRVSVVSIIKAILENIHHTNLNIILIILQSDYAKCCKYKELIAMLALLNTRTQVKLIDLSRQRYRMERF